MQLIAMVGHLHRSSSTNPLKKFSYTCLMGKRRRGRPHIRWFDSVENGGGGVDVKADSLKKNLGL